MVVAGSCSLSHYLALSYRAALIPLSAAPFRISLSFASRWLLSRSRQRRLGLKIDRPVPKLHLIFYANLTLSYLSLSLSLLLVCVWCLCCVFFLSAAHFLQRRNHNNSNRLVCSFSETHTVTRTRGYVELAPWQGFLSRGLGLCSGPHANKAALRFNK